jgi:cytochrome c oxidase assembly factor CtaG
VNAFVLLVAVTAAVWATPLGSAATKNQLLHLLVEVATLASGTLLFRSVLEPDPRRARLSVRDRAVLLTVTAGFLSGFGLALATRAPVPGTTAAGAGIASVAQVLTDQHRAAALLFTAAVALAGAAAVQLAGARRKGVKGKTSSVTA